MTMRSATPAWLRRLDRRIRVAPVAVAGLAPLLCVALPAAAQSPIAASVLPTSRSVEVNNWATVFATMINGGSSTLNGCSIAPSTSVPASFVYQTTNPATNALTGSPNTPVSIGASGSQSFVLSFKPTSAFDPTMIDLAFSCSGTSPAASTPGLNTVLLSGSTTPVPDLVALAATTGKPGIVSLSGTPDAGAFAVATINLGAGATITASINTGSATLPIGMGICQTNTATGQCSSALASTVTVNVASNATPTFGVFATAMAAIPFDPANNRIFVQFTDSSGAIRGATSVAVEATAPSPPAPPPPPPPPYHY